MCRYFLIIYLLCGQLCGIAQTADIIKRSAFVAPYQKNPDFAFVEPSTNITTLNFVAMIRAVSKENKPDIPSLFQKIKERAHELGANSFRLNSYKKNDGSGVDTLILDTYYGTVPALNTNFDNHETNTIYIFGIAENSGKAISFKVDGEKKELTPGTYYKHQMSPGKDAEIKKGGIMGAALLVKWAKDKPATFLTLTGFGLGGGAPLPPGTIGVSFNAGRINYLDGDLGYLLVGLLSRGN